MFPMSKIFKSIVGLAIIGSSLAFAAAPAKAESKPAQCQRFKQAIVTLNRQISSAKSNSSSNSVENLDRLLNATATGLKQFQNRQFSDPKIRGFQQSALDIHVKLHDDVTNLADAIEGGNQSAAEQIFGQFATAVSAANKVDKQIAAYCGRSK
jgi:gas vesicle protein